ncbi:cystatin-A [Polychytrium aggregatum]|uniref:cystatin-A n=1 Tax=Polychytrium aggregatum TaxID=110093 RepID=UPI0022FDF2A0|nr:cystatin-A [Polychytrium aggregatum]KAI9202049.1 cystatin-A [Polychytrium aggregatum]
MNPGGKASLTTIDSTTDPKIVQLVQDLKPQIEAKTSATYSTFVPVAYRSQVVAGTNYYVKIQVADNPPSYIHAVIYKHFSNPAVVTSAATDKSFSDDL